MGFILIDARTGQRYGYRWFPTADAAWREITLWQNQYEAGGRLAMTRAELLNIEPKAVRAFMRAGRSLSAPARTPTKFRFFSRTTRPKEPEP